MSVDYKVQAIYDSEIQDVTSSAKKWQDVLKLAGQLYRYEFDNIIMVHAQHPHSTLIADYDTWKKVGRYVKRGSKGIAIFPSRALNPYMRYVFDIGDTGGRDKKLTWDFEGNNLDNYINFLISEGQLEQLEETDRGSMEIALKVFTGTNVWGIIRIDFEDRLSELTQLTGSVIKEVNEKREGLLQNSADMEDLIYRSIMYVVGTRCGFDLSVQEQDFSLIVNIKDEEIVYRLGSLVCDVSCSVLREFSRNLKTIEKQTNMSAERRIAYGIRNDLPRSGRSAVSGYSRDVRAGEEFNEFGQIRKNGDELSQGEREESIQLPLPLWEAGREDASGGSGSQRVVGSVDGAISAETQTRESVINHRDVETERTGEDAGRGSGATSDRNAFSLENASEVLLESSVDQELNRELNRELKEINTFGKNEEAGQYVQASFFDVENRQLKRKFTYVEPKKEVVVPHEFVVQTLLRGTGFVEGMTRVCKIYEDVIEATERAKLIKKEYGQGGAGWPLEGYGLHGYDTFHAQGLRFQWRDAEGEKEGYISWKAVESEIAALILTGEYHQTFDEIAMDGIREDDDIISTKYREIESQTVEDEFDDFAIPDEPESYHSFKKNESILMTDEELAEEDRLVSMAEYGAEMAAEAEKFEVIPTDYAKKIAELDADIRDAMEMLITECSCYAPFKAFLQDIVNSEYLLMPNKLEFLSEVVLNGKDVRKAYCNNQYGLIEYTLKPYELVISIKNRFVERVIEQTG